MLSSILLSVALMGAADSTDCAPPLSWSVTPLTTNGVAPPTTKTKDCSCDCCVNGNCFKNKTPQAIAPEIPSVGVGTPKKSEPLIEPFREFRMTDKYGQVWTHSNKTYLEKFIKNRNATPVYSNCPTGTCPARR